MDSIIESYDRAGRWFRKTAVRFVFL